MNFAFSFFFHLVFLYCKPLFVSVCVSLSLCPPFILRPKSAERSPSKTHRHLQTISPKVCVCMCVIKENKHNFSHVQSNLDSVTVGNLASFVVLDLAYASRDLPNFLVPHVFPLPFNLLHIINVLVRSGFPDSLSFHCC